MMKFVYCIFAFVLIVYGFSVAVSSVSKMHSTGSYLHCKTQQEIAPGDWECLNR